MRTGTVSYKLEDLKKGVIIPIGFVGENDFTRVIFDAEEIYKKYPSASVSMKVQPPKGGIYPATVTRDGNSVIWQVKEADVANRGGGELQLTFIDGETKIKTYIAKTDVKRSLAGNGPAPDPVQGWIDDAEEVLDDLEAMDTIAKNAQAGDIGKALSPKTVEDGVVTEWQYIETGGGTEDYSDLENKPSIGGVTLAGDKSLHDLGIAAESAIPDVSGKANLSVVAPAFDQATANDAGSLVTYTDGVVYVLPEGHTAGTTWANTTKTATNIDTELLLQKNAIEGIEDILDIQEGPGGIVFTGDESDDYKIQTNVSTLAVIDSSKTHSIKANVTGNTNITISKDYSTRFVITTFASEPVLGEIGIRRIDNAASVQSYDMTLATGENWLLITYFHDDEDASRNVTTIKNSFVITSEDAGGEYSQRIDAIEGKTDESFAALGLKGSVNLFDPNGTSANLMMTINQGQQAYTSSSKVHGMYCKIPSNTVFTVVKPQTSRFVIGTSVAEPVAGGALTQIVDVSSSMVSYTLTSGANDKYFFMAYFHNDDDASKDIDTIIAGIKVFIGTVWREGMSNFLHPLSAMPGYMTKLLSYKPLGTLTKPYICLSCDDGEATLATDTIPALKGYKTTYGQNIPVTFGLLDTSPVITNNTYKALVQEMVSDYGCSVAVHGAVTLTDLDEIGLQDELKKQKDALTTAGFTPNGIIYPQHSFNDLVCAVAGGQYGVCCTGGNYTDLTYGAGNACGYRSNMYALYRLSLFNSSMTTQKIHDYVDYIEANNMLMCAFWHDSSFAANHALLDELVSYAVGKGIDFITIGDILKIV